MDPWVDSNWAVNSWRTWRIFLCLTAPVEGWSTAGGGPRWRRPDYPTTDEGDMTRMMEELEVRSTKLYDWMNDLGLDIREMRKRLRE